MSHNRLFTASLLQVLLCAALPAMAQDRAALVSLVNAYRAAPHLCDGRRAGPVAPLAPHAALASVRIAPGVFLDQTLERAGYAVARAEVISVSGAEDAGAVMALIGDRYCRTLLSKQFSNIGVSRDGDSWQLVLAQPAPPSKVAQLPGQREVGNSILQAVNTARASARSCGDQRFPAAPALAWNTALADAALAHSRDMALQRYLSHQGKDGRGVADRALQAQYRWLRIGENIAVGQESPEDAVAGWLGSPGHCANIMNPGFTEMGAAYGVNQARAYWTQVLGAPR